jgi:hypothetical protein
MPENEMTRNLARQNHRQTARAVAECIVAEAEKPIPPIRDMAEQLGLDWGAERQSEADIVKTWPSSPQLTPLADMQRLQESLDVVGVPLTPGQQETLEYHLFAMIGPMLTLHLVTPDAEQLAAEIFNKVGEAEGQQENITTIFQISEMIDQYACDYAASKLEKLRTQFIEGWREEVPEFLFDDMLRQLRG